MADVNMSYASIAKPWRNSPFAGFLPLDTTVSELPFEYLSRVADRARKLLSNRTNEEVILAAKLIDGVLDAYFDWIRNEVAFELLKQYPGAAKFLSKDFLDGGERVELQRMEDDVEELMCGGYVPNLLLTIPNYPTKNSVDDVDSLKEIAELLHGQLPSPAPDTLDEYFAVLSLLHVDDCRRFLAIAFIGGDNTQLGQPSPNVVEALTIATQALAIALNAVCYAEHLAALQKIGVPLVGEKKSLKDLAQEFHKSIVSDRARRGANALHAEHRAFRKQALKFYDERKSEFRSVQAAARAISKDVPMEEPTIAEWIYAHRRQASVGTP